MRKSIYLFATIISILFISSCKEKVHDVPDSLPLGKYETGIFIINEGNFGSGNGSISYLNTNEKMIISEIYQLENSRNLGDVVQSMQINGDKAYVCVNNSNKVEIVNSKDFSELGVINDLSGVRYVSEEFDGFVYASCWGNGGQVKHINTSTNQVSYTIPAGNGPEGMIASDNKLFIANSGGLDVDNTITVISMSNNQLTKTISVGYSPKQFVKDSNGMLWVLCSGTGSWSSVGTQPSMLVQIDPISLSKVLEIELFTDLQPGNIGIDKTGTVIVIGGGFGVNGLYKVMVNNPQTPSDPFIEGSFYGFNVNTKNSEIIATDAGDYTNNGSVFHYSFLGEKLGEYEAGIIPNGAAF